METQTVQITPDGMLVLPEKLRESLKDKQEILVSWDENLIVIKRQNKVDTEHPMSKEDKVERLFEIMDDLASLNEVDAITEEEIQAEINAYRAEKRAKRLEQ